ncbi:hypothetical protein F5B22DRAFT_615408 [Xylaria bambusicola]|uniref:uncharacterized protein n=1 Tax=Xylaria bambusicola TaxID=326684 RepID=UPI0020075BDD|nr:uncharacterized protein F5B22DRAFT_615408 [Xylaria bambusicola]KAI0512571.1 hypothetical protein F5B22DRAFT_615408 [Xylaria bambusicola]
MTSPSASWQGDNIHYAFITNCLVPDSSVAEMAPATRDPAPQTSHSHDSLSGEVIAIVTVFQAFSTLALVLRLWTRLKIQHLRLGADNLTIIVAWTLSLALDVLIAFQTRYGLGKHVTEIPPDTDFMTSNILFYAHQPIYYISVSLTKVSIILFYFTLLPQRSYRNFLRGMMVIVILTGLTCTIAGIFQCNPIASAWNANIHGTCFNQPALFFANGGLNITQDLVLYVLPTRILWSMNLPLKQRIALVGIFVVGGLTIIAGIIRIPSLQEAVMSNDPTWDHVGSSIWSSIECNVGIVCACLVHLKPLITHLIPTFSSSSRSSRGGRLLKLSDKPNEGGANSPLQTVGRRQGSKPVGILTEIEQEESAVDSPTQLVPAGYMGDANVTVEHREVKAQKTDSNAIYATRQYAIHYDHNCA